MNLANLGLSGLNAAQNRLQTAGHNINNAATQGYNRQSVLVASAGSAPTGAGYLGRGVQVVTIERAYDGFLSRQLAQAQSAGASLQAYGAEIVQVNNLLADRTVGIAPALQRFFDAVHAIASAPADSAARQELLGRASSLVGQINDVNAFLEGQRNNINTQISTLVAQINNYAERVRDLNTQITTARAVSVSGEPNDLLDQRDQLISELGQLIGVKAIEQDGQVSLTIGQGQLLLGGNKVYPLLARPSSCDAGRLVVAYAVPGAQGRMTHAVLPDERIQGGALGGLLRYRSEALDNLQNQLGRMAVGLAQSFNALHEAGQDLSGATGAELFVVGNVAVTPDAANRGSGEVSAEIIDANALTTSEYIVERTELGFTVVAVQSGEVTELTGDQHSVDGVAFSLDTSNAVQGDRWLVQPTRSAGALLRLAVHDPAAIAAAAPGTGMANGEIALNMAKLQTAKVLGNGALSLNEAYAQIVNTVGVLTQQNRTQDKAQTALIQQNFAAQQSVSGVNLNEEYINLERFQEQYQASARLIAVSGTLFDTLLSLRS